MIRYALTCESGHAFDAWFRDSDAYEIQNAEGHVTCARCGSPRVRKAMMAPAITRGARSRTTTEPGQVGPEPAPEPVINVPAPPEDERFRAVRAMVRDLHRRLKENADDVGSRFPEEARKIHEGESPPRGIYGTATRDEVRSLVEDGVGVLPIPLLPDDRN